MYFGRLLLSILFVYFLNPYALAKVWDDDHKWEDRRTPSWETLYQQWLQQQVHKNFFSQTHLANGRKNPYYGIRHDCADVVYSLRIIFAYEHQLPIAFKDPTGGTRLITNQMNRWNHLKTEIERVREFLKFIHMIMSTRSIPNDTYPAAVQTHSIRSGTVILTTAINHHSWTIKNLYRSGNPWLIFNSVEASQQSFTLKERHNWPNPAWVYEGDFSPQGQAGFRNWRLEKDLNKPVWLAQGYSLEQYQLPIQEIFNEVQNRLAKEPEAANDKVNRFLNDACQSLQERHQAVQESQFFLIQLKNKYPQLTFDQICLNEKDFDLHSTPSRDRRLFDEFKFLRALYYEIYNSGKTQDLTVSNQNILQKIFPYIHLSTKQESELMSPQNINESSVCVTPYFQNQYIDLAEAKRRLFLGLLSNNPNDSIGYRWGDIPGPSAKSQSCPTWGSWFPDLGI